MNLNQLEYFIAAAETLNFTKAAQNCFISQTAMSQQIQTLEKTVGVPLFVRDKHHVELTTAGEVFLKEARAITERSASALRLARTAASGIAGDLTIGLIRGYGLGEATAFLRQFHRSFPNIRISLIRDNMSGLFDKLERGDCDCIFTVAPAPYHRPFEQMEHMYIKSFPLMAVLYPGHILSSRSSLTYSDLRGEDFIIMQPAGRSKDEAEESMLVYDRGGYLPNVIASEGDPETLLLMVSIGMGISILPEYIISLYRKNTDIRILPLLQEDGSAETADFELSWPQKNMNPAVAKLTELIKT